MEAVLNSPVEFLGIPVQQKPSSDSFDTRPKAIDKWFSSLPRANSSETSRLIYQVLKETSQLALPYKHRLYLLQKIEPVLSELETHLSKHYLGKKFPLSKRSAKVAALNRYLHTEMAMGYKIVLRDLIKKRQRAFCWLGKNCLGDIIYFAIAHYSKALLVCYQLYSLPKPQHWKNIHRLMLLAEQKKTASHSPRSGDGLSILEKYQQILLFALSDPYRFPQHQLATIYQHLGDWTQFCRLEPYKKTLKHKKLLIDLKAAGEPSYLQDVEHRDPRFIRILDTSRLDASRLAHQFHGKAEHYAALSGDTIKQIALSLGVVPKRAHPRRPGKSKLRVAIGLNAAHYFLNGQNLPGWLDKTKTNLPGSDPLLLQESAQPSFESRPVSTTNKQQSSDVWQQIFPDKPSGKFAFKPKPAKLASAPLSTSHEWQLLNESVGGYCLFWKNPETVQAQVGEIICISHDLDEQSDSWLIGSIRWIKQHPKLGIQLGVQILSPSAEAVSLCRQAGDSVTDCQRALLLPEIARLNQPATLITTPRAFKLHQRLLLQHNGEQKALRLIESLETQQSYSRLAFQYSQPTAIKDKINPSRVSAESLDDEDFDSLWGQF